MTTPPIPVVFAPLLQPKPWGGRRLASCVNKQLSPGAARIGESWEIVSLPEHVSVVARGPLAGTTLDELVQRWGERLLGGADLIDGQFPLLVKFLDAAEHLSVQVHPKPTDGSHNGMSPGVKHEAWYVVEAERGAELFIGLKPGVSVADFAAVANTPAVADLLQRWPARPGRCFTLPSGVPHALGAGVLVAEVQTPSDITYRLYDWDRVGLDGQPRELHVEEALANLRDDVPAEMILGPRSHIAGTFATVSRLAASDRFLIDRVQMMEGLVQPLPHAEMVIWMILKGALHLQRGQHITDAGVGDVVLIPAESYETRVELHSDVELLEVKVPIRSSLAGYPRPEREAATARGGLVELTRGGRSV